MHIVVTRSGGFAGITLRREIDTSGLPSGERRDIEQLVARAKTRVPPKSSPDAFLYEITIDGETFETADGSAWQPLIDRVLRGVSPDG